MAQVNDELPVEGRGSRRSLLMVRSAANDELWPMLLEKAYAKYYGGYGEIEGGFVHLGLVDLTGLPRVRIRVRGRGTPFKRK